MPTFKKKRVEIIDARQFTGGVQNGTDLVFWINCKDGRASWREATNYPELITLYHAKYQWTYVYVGDWIVLKQDGSFTAMRPQEFEAEYEQV